MHPLDVKILNHENVNCLSDIYFAMLFIKDVQKDVGFSKERTRIIMTFFSECRNGRHILGAVKSLSLKCLQR